MMVALRQKINDLTLPQGFILRPGDMDDIPAVVELLNDFSEHYLGVRDFTVAEIRTEWISPGFDPQEDNRLVFSSGGRLVGYVEVWTRVNPPVHPWIWARVHPEFVQLGIGEYLIAWAEDRAVREIKRVPKGLRVSLRSGTFNVVDDSKQILENCGYELIRHSFRMQIEMNGRPPEPIWPEGISLRIPNPVQEIEAIYRVDDEAFQDHFGHIEEPFEDGLAHFRHFTLNDEGYDPALWFLAMDGDEIAGVCICRKWSYEDRETGFVASLGVRKPWRKRGIGLALLQHSFRVFYDRGQYKVALGVDAENLTGALRLYEKAGMRVHRQFDLYEKELRSGKEISVESLES
jgi:mycothiol synthase